MATGKSVPQGAGDGGPASLSAGWVLFFYGILAAVAVVWRLWADGTLPWRSSPATPVSPAWARLGTGIAAGLALVAVSRASAERTRAGRALASELRRLLGPLSGGRVWLLALASGLGEEVLFRGALQPQVGLAAATLLFGAAHYVPRPGLRSWAVFALFAGVLFGVLFEVTGDLLAPAVAHVLVNGLNLRWLARRFPDPGSEGGSFAGRGP